MLELEELLDSKLELEELLDGNSKLELEELLDGKLELEELLDGTIWSCSSINSCDLLLKLELNKLVSR